MFSRGAQRAPHAPLSFAASPRMGDASSPRIEDGPGRRSSDGRPQKGLRQLDTLRVLVADDHRLMLAAVRRAFADAEDFEIVGEVSVGSQVVPAVRETKPDVVLLDMRMPELDGLACLERLRKHDPTIAVVMLSSYSDEAQIEAARQAGALGYVVKTVEPVDLAEVLRQALSGQAVRGLGSEGAARPPLPSRSDARSASAKVSFSRRSREGSRTARSAASSGSASRPSSSTCATSTGSLESRAGPKRLDMPTARASSRQPPPSRRKPRAARERHDDRSEAARAAAWRRRTSDCSSGWDSTSTTAHCSRSTSSHRTFACCATRWSCWSGASIAIRSSAASPTSSRSSPSSTRTCATSRIRSSRARSCSSRCRTQSGGSSQP